MALYVGAISGTSVDGLDLALVETITSRPKVLASTTVLFPTELQTRIVALAQMQVRDLKTLGRVHAALGTFTGHAIKEFLKSEGITRDKIRAVGSHGQTVHHDPKGIEAFSLQIGDPSRIAEITGIDTVADFRSRDIAAGGEGAPLVPVFHKELFRSDSHNRVVLNIGGIANVTYLPAESDTSDVCGFDTGPGNGLIDAYMQHAFDLPFDESGTTAESGVVNQQLLSQLVRDPWLALEPPKSTGKEHFNLQFVQSAIERCGLSLSDTDIVRTLTEFTAKTISRSIKKWCCSSGEIIVSGGGRLNRELMRRIDQNSSNFDVQPCESLGIDGDGLEAAAFAYLAHLFVKRLSGNLPSVTGADKETVLGCLYPG